MTYRQLESLFNDYNRRAFAGNLTGIKLEVIDPADGLDYLGRYCDCENCPPAGTIAIDLSAPNVPEILLHEMVHAASGDQYHRERFQRELKRAQEALYGVKLPSHERVAIGAPIRF